MGTTFEITEAPHMYAEIFVPGTEVGYDKLLGHAVVLGNVDGVQLVVQGTLDELEQRFMAVVEQIRAARGRDTGKPADTSKATIADLPRRPADHHVTLSQIGRGTLMNLGARDYTHDDERGELTFRIGDARTVRKVLVILTADDLYAVEIGRLHRRTREWIPEAWCTGVAAAQLGDTLIRLHHQAVYGR